MFLKNLSDCKEFTANDGCRIRELLHPKNDPVDLPYSIAVAKITAGKRSYRHKLSQSEVYYILAGQGRMHIGDEMREARAGDVILIPANSAQWIENTGNTELQFIAIVNPPWTEQGDVKLV
jgi:mannose-6-phosphate isomerase-like protein (cupin superfamily)